MECVKCGKETDDTFVYIIADIVSEKTYGNYAPGDYARGTRTRITTYRNFKQIKVGCCDKCSKIRRLIFICLSIPLVLFTLSLLLSLPLLLSFFPELSALNVLNINIDERLHWFLMICSFLFSGTLLFMGLCNKETWTKTVLDTKVNKGDALIKKKVFTLDEYDKLRKNQSVLP